jgi:hypothetical protein
MRPSPACAGAWPAAGRATLTTDRTNGHPRVGAVSCNPRWRADAPPAPSLSPARPRSASCVPAPRSRALAVIRQPTTSVCGEGCCRRRCGAAARCCCWHRCWRARPHTTTSIKAPTRFATATTFNCAGYGSQGSFAQCASYCDACAGCNAVGITGGVNCWTMSASGPANYRDGAECYMRQAAPTYSCGCNSPCACVRAACGVPAAAAAWRASRTLRWGWWHRLCCALR